MWYSVGSAWKRSLKRTGIEKFRFHDLRHTWASWHVMNGTSLQELMELGGWKSYEMVLRYTRLAPEHLSTATARIERGLGVVTDDATISLRWSNKVQKTAFVAISPNNAQQSTADVGKVSEMPKKTPVSTLIISPSKSEPGSSESGSRREFSVLHATSWSLPLGFDLRNEAHLRTLIEDVIKSSEIEGERLDPDQVRSSIARWLGMDIAGLVPADRDVKGVVEMMLDATEKFDEPLTDERLLGWHAALFPTGRSGMVRIDAGAWRDDRDGPMQVVSGPVGREKVHYEAPPAERIDDEIALFLEWFANPGSEHPLLVAGLAHLTRWQDWFLGCLQRAIEESKETLGAVMVKARFWDRFAKEPLNDRQIKVLNKLLDAFEGKSTSSKWAKITKCSQDTATRDINNLIERGALKKDPGGGRSTSYSVVEQ